MTDRNLGKLTKWLRILGYDTACHTGNIDRSFLKRGAKEERIVLTRRRDMAGRSFLGQMFIVCSDKVSDQLSEVIEEYSLKPDPEKFLTVCLACNEKLENIQRMGVESCVPPYVFQTQGNFQICPRCEKIFWPGTHKDNVLLYLKRHNLIRHP